MKKLTALLLALALLSGCSHDGGSITPPPMPGEDQPILPVPVDPDPAPQPDPVIPDPPPAFTADTLPRLDGSTATIPLSEGIVQALLGYTPAQATQFVKHNKTHSAYVNLTQGLCDIIFVTPPSADELQLLGEDFEVTRVVKDAFVFLTNKENPVDNLTLEQLRGIYRGEITNWSQVGGADAPIIPYQRPVNSGSQTLFHKLILPPEQTMEPPMSQVVADMGGLIDAVSTYDNSRDALGYSVFYYASDMYTSERSRLIAVDGVVPTAETISNQQYPLWDGYYAVYRKDAAPDSPVRQLLNWLLSESGQQVAVQQGYVNNGPPMVRSSAKQDFLDKMAAQDGAILAYQRLMPFKNELKDTYGGACILENNKLQISVVGSGDGVLARYREILKEDLDVVVFKEVTYTLDYLLQLQKKLQDKLPTTGGGVNEKENHVVVYCYGDLESVRSVCQSDPELKDQPIVFTYTTPSTPA